MKSLLLAALALVITTCGFSQATTSAKVQKSKTEKVSPASKTVNKTVTTPSSKTTVEKKVTPTSVTKTTTTSPGPTKKDGTADMRYKTNKEAAKTTTTTHLKKDGTADKRFKENKKS